LKGEFAVHEITYYNLREKKSSYGIDLLFHEWDGANERVAVFGAHDDDPLLGAGYAMRAAIENGAEVFSVIFCKGDCGYSRLEQKADIVETRRAENENAFIRFGIKKENIIRFEYPDFGLTEFVGNKLTLEMIRFIRDNGITRVLIPNGYREHSDHSAGYVICMNDIVQSGDAVVIEIGKAPQKVKTYLQYSVWADFSPEDALIHDEPNIRANRAITCPEYVENEIREALKEYKSQAGVLEGLVAHRNDRRTASGFMELYIDLDPRPKLNFALYKNLIENIKGE
jgi:LmbE family N-acetylglucosaminyl deacetylase